MDLQLNGRKALVLGGGRGLGAAIANSLRSEGVETVTVSRSPAEPDRSAHILADLDQPDAPRRIIEALKDRGHAPDIIALNSGGPPMRRAHEAQPEEFASVLNRMLFAQIAISQAFLPGMRERGFGRILAVASTSVLAPIAGLVLSNSVRAALASWCKTLAGEVARDGVTVNLLLPGRISTDRLSSLRRARAQEVGISAQEVAERQMADIPAGRFGRPEEFGDLAAFLASPRAAYITGSAIKVDGGLTQSL